MNSEEMFQVNSSHRSFNEKQRNLFMELDKVNVVLPQNKIQECDEYKDDLHNRFKCSSFKSLRGKESIFKKPEMPIRKCLPHGRIPDFRKNPHKWTKYSLDDVKDDDISERGNRVAALTFLKDLENRKLNPEITEKNTPPDKIIFQKSKLAMDTSDKIQSKQMFANTKVIMPEYKVGQKIKKEKKNKEKRNGQTSKQLTLSHLIVEDEN